MIKKVFQINKDIIEKQSYFLFYGANEGFKNEKILELFLNVPKNNIYRYEEKQILNGGDFFFDQIFTKSLFEEKKIVIINRASDKFIKILEQIIQKDIGDLTLLIDSGPLEKKSKLRNFFEKNKNLICVPFYEDNSETLSKIAKDFFIKNNISISQSNINLIINKSNGDRGNLKNELNKIKLYSLNKNKIKTEELLKLTNLIENHSISELIDNCLAQNIDKTIKILNDNKFETSDCILITRTFLIKAKKILLLSNEFEKNKNIELTLSSARPPIFWKEKEITKKQIYKWSSKNLKSLIYRLNDIELLIKINITNSINLITDFLLKEASRNSNN